MSLVTFVDTECNSLDTENGFIMELAWGLYHVERKRFIKTYSSLLKWNRFYPVDVAASEITGLSSNYCEYQGMSADAEFTKFYNVASQSEFLVGHNIVGYDRPMLASNLQRAWPGMVRNDFLNLKIMDTYLDCPFPKNFKQKSLKYLALDHGYVLTGAHQALNDVYACAHIFSSYDYEELKKAADTKVVLINKKVDYWDQNTKQELKEKGFYWNPNKKAWEKRIREYFLPNMQLNFSFDKVIEF